MILNLVYEHTWSITYFQHSDIKYIQIIKMFNYFRIYISGLHFYTLKYNSVYTVDIRTTSVFYLLISTL